MNYYMNGLEKIIMELQRILMNAEESIVIPRKTTSTTLVLAIKECDVKRKRYSKSQC